MSRRVVAAVADSGPVLVLAGIAAAGSFTHIRDTAAEHGQGGWMAWAIAVCIDLTCVMAARERQRDRRTGRRAARLSWPTLVLVGGILLSLAANLAQAETSMWGWLSAATPAGAFLVAVSMLERRATGSSESHSAPSAIPSSDALTIPSSDTTAVPSSDAVAVPSSDAVAVPSSDTVAVPPSDAFTVPSSDAAAVPPSLDHAAVPSSTPAVRDDPGPVLPAVRDEQIEIGVPAAAQPRTAGPAPGPAAPLLGFARRVADDHMAKHGRPITRDVLRGRLGVSNQLASDLLRQIRADSPA